jgi:hypothetical protein
MCAYYNCGLKKNVHRNVYPLIKREWTEKLGLHYRHIFKDISRMMHKYAVTTFKEVSQISYSLE